MHTLTESVRSATFGAIEGLAATFPSDYALGMFRQTCFNRFFEYEAKRVYDRGLMKLPIYLSVGQEHIPVAIANTRPAGLLLRFLQTEVWTS